MRIPALVFFLSAIGAPMASAQRGFEASSKDGFWRVGLQPVIELSYWHTDTPSPGLLSFGGTDFFQPRLSLGFSVAAGDHWLLHVLTRWDRGFEVGLRPDGDFRADEAFLRWRPLGDGRLNVQIGKFGTCFGNWVPRHAYWDDPFLMPPLPYDNLLAANDRTARSPSPATIANRVTRKRSWLPIIWGPSYATGVSVSGSAGRWDYAAEVKNASLPSRPDSWSPWEEDGSHPTVTGRVGYRPDAAWAFGVSASHGTYLRSDAEFTLLPGEERSDFSHTIVGGDVRWSHHQFQVLGEVMASRFATASAGNQDSLAYYLEGRWKVNSTIFLATRWAQQWNDDFVPAAGGGIRGYTRQIWRATAAAGFRVTENVLVKAEYSYNGADAKENVFALGFGLRF
jgi:hypothetical protein